MSATRRSFMQHSVVAAMIGAGATAEAAKKKTPLPAPPPQSAPKSSPGAPWLEAGELVSKMNWFNPPASVTFGPSPGTVTARARPKTDFWRKTFYGYVTDN